MGHNEVRLKPRQSARQKVHSSRIAVDPEPATHSDRRDYYGNDVRYFSVLEAHRQLTVTATSVVEVYKSTEVEASATMPWETARDEIRAYRDDESLQAFEFVAESPFVVLSSDLAAYAKESFSAARPLLAGAVELSSRIYKGFKYLPSSTTIDTTVAEVLRTRRGVCQDFAHVMIGMLRSIGIAARYVSGYLKSGAGAEASHAWVSVYVPTSGWVDIDPTNDVLPSDGHVTLAWGRDFGDVTPVKGVTLGGGEHSISVEVRVTPAEA